MPLPEVIRTTPRAQFLLAAFVVLMVAFAGVFQLIAIPFIKNTLGAAARPDAIVTVKWLLASLAGLGTLSGLVAMWHGGKTLYCGQYPPPGTWVWRDTSIKRKPRATWYGWSYIVSGALSCILCTVLVLYAWAVLSKSAPQHNLPKDITILQKNRVMVPSHP